MAISLVHKLYPHDSSGTLAAYQSKWVEAPPVQVWGRRENLGAAAAVAWVAWVDRAAAAAGDKNLCGACSATSSPLGKSLKFQFFSQL